MELGNALRNIVSVAKREIKSNTYTNPIWRTLKGGEVPSFMVVLEQPSANETVSEKIVVRGWALSLVGKTVQGDILINNQIVAPLVFNKERDDVFEAFNISADQHFVGFDQELDWDVYCGKEIRADLSVRIIHGRDISILGPVILSHTSSPYLLHQRGSYKEVWNSASINHQDAMTSVAGISNFEEFMESGRSSAETFQQIMGITPNDVVLEIGCGTGRVGATLAKLSREWIGSDISGNMLSYARENLKNFNNVRFEELSGCNLKPFPNNSIDKVYCTAVFMHLDSWDRFRYVQEAFRVIKPGGKIYIDNLNLAGDTAWAIFEELANLDSAKRPPHVSKHSTADELVTYLKRAGFTDIKPFPGGHMVGALGTKP